ncbi:MAG: DNA polymerase IV [Candidatus Parvarchaeum sp.]
MRFILLIDMDYFFAACEELKNPQLKEKPIAVVTDTYREGSKGVIMTCNYVARKYGVRSAMPASQGLVLCKDLILIKEDFKFYEEKSRDITNIIKNFSKKVEQVSIDESFVDISDNVSNYDESIDYAKQIKMSINENAKLPCSIGIGSNKLVAKMACDAAKPNGLKLVKQEEAKEFLAKLPVGKLYGIGEKTKEKLESMNIKTVGELASSNKMLLMQRLGSLGLELYNSANAIDEDEVITEYETKSIGRERTLKKDTTNLEEILPVLNTLCDEVLNEAKKEEYSFKTITLKMRYNDFTDHLKSKTIKSTNNLYDLERVGKELLLHYLNKEKPLRKIGIRIYGLTKSSNQKTLGAFIK